MLASPPLGHPASPPAHQQTAIWSEDTDQPLAYSRYNPAPFPAIPPRSYALDRHLAGCGKQPRGRLRDMPSPFFLDRLKFYCAVRDPAAPFLPPPLNLAE